MISTSPHVILLVFRAHLAKSWLYSRMVISWLCADRAGIIPLASCWASHLTRRLATRSCSPEPTAGTLTPSRPPLAKRVGGVSEEEVRLHAWRGDCWITLYGEVYDVTDYLRFHPGKEFLLQAAGQDASGLFESVHSTHAKALLRSSGFRSSYLVGPLLGNTQRFKFRDPLYMEISAEVEAYFKAVAGTRWARGGSLEQATVYLKFLIVVGLAGLTKYYSLWCKGVAFNVLHGVSLLLLIFNVSHGACHGELIARYPKWFSRISQMMHIFLGSSSGDWMAWHNMSHHQHTNTCDDVDTNRSFPVFRLHDHSPHRWYFCYQHIYVWLIYPFSHVATFLMRDKSSGLLYVVACNMLSWWFSRQSCCLGLLIESLVFGLGFVMINHVTHTNDKTEYTHNTDATVGWGEHQIRSSSDWGARLAGFFLGGINYQIEHHLFQSVHHMHYPALAKIVREAAHRRNVPYVAFPTYTSALHSHYQLLFRMGQPSSA
eukprot:CAMPEP_0171056412 /NCGR_PEP_ID=MMETSP0766_2-20121228/924_1 /TAXON_ID=439317 /ORGANISM="Gambierdiscus australes, Strain CAWD 149" /LENGTH=486 /DNA_ID=CAMNT_0011511309 /DNA_START=71 /DNA_END=1531 /DNA_ORIENTATION=-